MKKNDISENIRFICIYSWDVPMHAVTKGTLYYSTACSSIIPQHLVRSVIEQTYAKNKLTLRLFYMSVLDITNEITQCRRTDMGRDIIS